MNLHRGLSVCYCHGLARAETDLSLIGCTTLLAVSGILRTQAGRRGSSPGLGIRARARNLPPTVQPWATWTTPPMLHLPPCWPPRAAGGAASPGRPDLGGPGTKPTGTGSASPRAVGAPAKDRLGLAGRVLTPPAPARPPPRGRGCARLGPVRPRRAGSNPTVIGPAPPCGRRCRPCRACLARTGRARHYSLSPAP